MGDTFKNKLLGGFVFQVYKDMKRIHNFYVNSIILFFSSSRKVKWYNIVTCAKTITIVWAKTIWFIFYWGSTCK